jgi:hypothetical protein
MRICAFFLKGTDKINDQIEIVQFVVNHAIAKSTLYVCILSLIVSAVSLLVSLVSLLK